MYKFFVSILATVFTLLSLIVGIMLANSPTLTFMQMICYDVIFIGQFLTFLWCAILFYRNPQKEE